MKNYFLIFFFSFSVNAELILEITKGSDNPYKIAIINNNFFIWYPFLNRFYLNPKSGGLSIEQFEVHPPETHTVPLLWLSIALLVSATK